MPEQETPSTEETPNEETPQTPPEGEAPQGDGVESTEEKPQEETVPPEVLRKELTDARAEAANYRVRLRETEAKFANAKTPEEFEAAVNELKAQNEALERQILLNNVAAKFELPPALAKRLTGSTPEELEADAKELQKLVAPPAPETLGGGLTPSDGDTDFDPVRAARAARKRRF
ncbi:putative scaffold protein [Streptomyces phage phiHau3]|uniref:Putative scaffold protein n=1 Tax=Streptomyces phage phiHau3 TaxID=1204524 RepID=K4I2C6_9CAUD|nr:head scaffolding protein [Streptomyces phage phiHau3]AFU61990.1 putative scaffold protein [Streptomyces phage phiHau3]